MRLSRKKAFLIKNRVVSNRNSDKTDINILEHDRKNNSKSKNNNEKDHIEHQIMELKTW